MYTYMHINTYTYKYVCADCIKYVQTDRRRYRYRVSVRVLGKCVPLPWSFGQIGDFWL